MFEKTTVCVLLEAASLAAFRRVRKGPAKSLQFPASPPSTFQSRIWSRATHAVANSFPIQCAPVQLLRLWYPYLSVHECELLAEAAPSSHPPEEEEVDTSHSWGPGDMAIMKREFAALDKSGDGTVDLHVRHLNIQLLAVGDG